jgi:hypothetical protein
VEKFPPIPTVFVATSRRRQCEDDQIKKTGISVFDYFFGSILIKRCALDLTSRRAGHFQLIPLVAVAVVKATPVPQKRPKNGEKLLDLIDPVQQKFKFAYAQYNKTILSI